MSEEKVKRQPVKYLWTGLNWDFIRLLAEIALYAQEKYKSYAQYTNARLDDDKEPINHAFEHITQYMAGMSHDHFGTHEHQLAAAAYNLMMEYFYLKVYGTREYPVLMKQRMYALARQTLEAQGVKFKIDDDGKIVHLDHARGNGVEKIMPPPEKKRDDVPAGSADWAEGISQFNAQWQRGLEGARTPETVRKWQAMVDIAAQLISNLSHVGALTDEGVTGEIAALRAKVFKELGDSRTPEVTEVCQAQIGALDTLRGRIPEMFPKKPETEASP